MAAYKRALKWISWALAGIVVLALLGVAVLVLVLDPNGFKPRIEAAVRDATGREFTLVGDIELKFFPWLALRTGEGRFGNPPGFASEPMAKWRSARLGVKLFPLLGGELVVDRIGLDGADVQLLIQADGKANWQGIVGDEPATTDTPKRRLTINGIDLRDSRVAFIDERVPRRIVVDALNLTTGEIAPDEPFTNTRIAGNLHMEGFPAAGLAFEFAMPKVTLTEDYSKLDIREFTVKLDGLEAEGSVGGTLGDPLALAGKIDSNRFDLRALLVSVGIAAPKTTDPQALGQFELDATWGLDGGAMQIDPLTLNVDDTHFTGNFRRGAGDDPIGEFVLRGDRLDIARYVPPTDPASAPFVLPTAALRALKFRGVLELDQVTYDDIAMKGVTLRLLLDEQGLRSTPREGKS